jgi:hypothetical protein
MWLNTNWCDVTAILSIVNAISVPDLQLQLMWLNTNVPDLQLMWLNTNATDVPDLQLQAGPILIKLNLIVLVICPSVISAQEL